MRRKKYLNNKDLLKEIHKSKNSFSSYIDPEIDNQYDIILPSLERVNIRTVAQAKRNRADRLGKRAYEEAVLQGQQVKQAQFAIDWKKIDWWYGERTLYHRRWRDNKKSGNDVPKTCGEVWHQIQLAQLHLQ